MSMHSKQKLKEIQIKCSSLPPGLAGPTGDGNKLSRSRSNAGSSKSQDLFATLGEEDEDKKEKNDKSFFGRLLFPRKSGKKKKIKEEKTITTRSIVEDNTKVTTRGTINIDSNLSIRPNALVRTGPAARQRVQPMDIPASPDLNKHEEKLEKTFVSSSPLHAELESHFRSKQLPPTPPKSPRIPSEEITTRSKIRLPALSTLQQRVLLLKDEEEIIHKSLEIVDGPLLPPKPIVKSHSFKSATEDRVYVTSKVFKDEANFFKLKAEEGITKSISLDSVTPDAKLQAEPNLEVNEEKVYPVVLKAIEKTEVKVKEEGKRDADDKEVERREEVC